MLSNAQCPYYQSRSTEAALCEAFPVDEILIRGLRELQVHLQGKGFDINIPRLNVMNAAHCIAAYLFVSDHTAGQIELDAMVYGLARYDRYQALFIQMVLAAILNRTEGKRARMYRSIILDDRCEEFNEGVSLYEQFLEHTEKHFCEDDFLIDVAEMVLAIRQQQEQIQQNNEELQQLKQQNKELMENQQRNAPVINVAGNYIDIHDNQHCAIYATEPKSATPQQDIDNTPSAASDTANTQMPSIPFLVPDKLSELGTYSVSEFVALYHDAVKAGAPKLSQFIKHYRELNVLNTNGYNKKKTFEELKAFFGDEMNFGYPNFAAYY